MKTARMTILLAAVLALSIASGAWAVDDGQSKPYLANASLNSSNSSVDMIPLTSGAGNIKGFQCTVYPSTGFYPSLRLHFYVDGAAAQTLSISPGDVLYNAHADGYLFSDFVPLNVRFDTSIRVNFQRLTGGGSGLVTCWLSWGLD